MRGEEQEGEGEMLLCKTITFRVYLLMYLWLEQVTDTAKLRVFPLRSTIAKSGGKEEGG